MTVNNEIKSGEVVHGVTTTQPPKKRFEIMQATELQKKKFAPTKWIINTYLPQGLAILASKPKVGKSWLALDMAISVATGSEFLCKGTQKHEVLYLALEDSYPRLKSRLEILLGTTTPPDGLALCVTADNLRTGLMEQLDTYLQERPNTGLIIIDTFEYIRGGANKTDDPYYNLKVVFADSTENGITMRNVIATLKKPIHKGEKGSWLNPTQQRTLLENLPQDILGKQILFYIMTGARISEAMNTTIDFEKRVAYIKREKTEDSGIPATAMPLSEKFCNMIKGDWDNMFRHKRNHIGNQITEFLKSIGIHGKSTHDLRHTFSSNIYYLGTDPKMHQYLMAHTSIKMSYDTYTTLDPTIKKQDILDIWGDMYPEF